MKKDDTTKYSCRVTVRYTLAELQQLNKLLQASTCKKISGYIRKTSLNKPIIITHRNKSADDFLSEMLLLKNELNAIGNNFNQAVHRLHILDDFPEIKTWVILNESSKRILFKKIDEIKEKLNQIYQQWLQG